MLRKPPMLARHPVSFADARAAGLTRGVCLHVVDGDTADFLLDLGWYHYAYTSLRLAGVDAAEIRGGSAADRKRAAEARRRLAVLLKGRPVLVESHQETITFGRFIADVYAPATPGGARRSMRRVGGMEWLDVGKALLREGLARSRADARR